jgi:hypothetical protein
MCRAWCDEYEEEVATMGIARERGDVSLYRGCRRKGCGPVAGMIGDCESSVSEAIPVLRMLIDFIGRCSILNRW